MWNFVAPSPVLDKTRLIVMGTSHRVGGELATNRHFYSVVRDLGGYGKSFLLRILMHYYGNSYLCTSLMSAFHLSYPGRTTRAPSLLMLINLSRGTDPRPE